MIINKNIYFICTGTSVNNIISSISKFKMNGGNQTMINYLFSKKKSNNKNSKNLNDIQLYKDPKLFTIGIKELNIFQKNNFNNEILVKNRRYIYTALDTLSLESAFILYQSIDNSYIYPIPYISNNKDIVDLSTFTKFKNKFGELNNNISKVSKYWEYKTESLNFRNTNITKLSSTINWKYITKRDNNSKYFIKASYNFYKFEELLIEICKTDTSNDILIVANPSILIDILKKNKNIKFDKDKDIVEYTSLWKQEIRIEDNSIKYINYKKLYPTEFNHKPLLYDSINNLYSYIFKNNKYILFNSTIPIPYNFLILMSYKVLPKNIIDYIYTKLGKKNNIIENKKPTYISFDNFK